MRINQDKLNQPGKLYFWVEHNWAGFSPTLPYAKQAEILRRRADAIEYAEQGWRDGIVVILFSLADRSGFMELVCVDTPLEFNNYFKQNEAFLAMRPGDYAITRTIDWDSGREAFLQMVSRLHVRAEYEKRGDAQPDEATLKSEAVAFRDAGSLDSLFSRLA